MKKIFVIIGVLGITSVSLYFIIARNSRETAVPVVKRTIICPSPWNEKWASPQDTEIKNPRTVYYVSNSTGKDSNSGVSVGSPWKTLGKVNSQTFLPGDIVLLKRGDRWNEALIPPTSGEIGKPILYGAYGGNNGRPIIETNRWGQTDAILIAGKNYLIFNNLDIRNAQFGIQILNSDFLIFDHMTIGSDVRDVGILINNGSDNGVIQYNVIDGGTERKTERDMIRLMDGSNWEIHHNLIANFGHDGINLMGRIPKWHDVEARVTKNNIHHNEFFNNLDYGRSFSTQGNGQGYASFNRFYDNYIHNVQVSIQLQGDHNEVYRNVITDVQKSPQKSDDEVFQAAGISIQDYIYSENNKVYENVIAYTDGPGIWVGSRESGNEVKNNFIYSAGEYRGDTRALYNIGLYVPERTLKRNETPGAQVYEKNYIYSSHTENTVLYRGLHYENPSPITVAAFNNRSGQNGDRIVKNSDQKFSLTNDCKAYIEDSELGVLIGITPK
ncbi:MAG: right-handed parallel beta-helix repeat-containing protein [Parcubacteria group bacterium]|nr:right-handed parallel beta-helix repeat-containing protein [Parcubacteria group bacterium]